MVSAIIEKAALESGTLHVAVGLYTKSERVGEAVLDFAPESATRDVVVRAVEELVAEKNRGSEPVIPEDIAGLVGLEFK